jgi:hypothetical protein
MPNKEKPETNRSTKKEEIPAVTPEEIRRKEIAPHEGSTIGPSPTGNVGDSKIP